MNNETSAQLFRIRALLANINRVMAELRMKALKEEYQNVRL